MGKSADGCDDTYITWEYFNTGSYGATMVIWLGNTDGAAQNAPRPQGWHGDKHTTVLI